MRIAAIDVSLAELEQLVAQTGHGALAPEGQRKLQAAVKTLGTLAGLLAERETTIGELRALLLGYRTTEKTRKVLADSQPAPARGDAAAGPQPSQKKGHGRHGAAAYSRAPKLAVPHPTLKAKDRCPECWKGKVYPLAEPQSLVRIIGQPPL